MTLVDPVAPDASKTMMGLIRESGYVPPHNFLNANADQAAFGTGPRAANQAYTMSKQRSVDAVGGRMYIQQIDADGLLLEEWRLYNPWIKAVNFDELDYESDDILNVEVTIRYDWADINVNAGQSTANRPSKFDIQAGSSAAVQGPAGITGNAASFGTIDRGF